MRIKSRDDPAIAFLIGVHNHGAFVPNLGRVFGNDYTMIFARPGEFIYSGIKITRTNMTELHREDVPCSNDPSLYR